MRVKHNYMIGSKTAFRTDILNSKAETLKRGSQGSAVDQSIQAERILMSFEQPSSNLVTGHRMEPALHKVSTKMLTLDLNMQKMDELES